MRLEFGAPDSSLVGRSFSRCSYRWERSGCRWCTLLPSTAKVLALARVQAFLTCNSLSLSLDLLREEIGERTVKEEVSTKWESLLAPSTLALKTHLCHTNALARVHFRDFNETKNLYLSPDYFSKASQTFTFLKTQRIL